MQTRAVQLRAVAFDHPDADALIELVQQEYVARYGGRDEGPVDIAMFAPPHGVFLVAYQDGEPVACGGWRPADPAEPTYVDGDAEIKRMYVAPRVRGRGLARLILAELERSAVDAGRRRFVLETGQEQPEAVALYTSSGYAPVSRFGFHRDEPVSIHLGKQLTSEDQCPSTP